MGENENKQNTNEDGKPHRLTINIAAENEKLNMGKLSSITAREMIMNAGGKITMNMNRILSEKDSIEIGNRTNLFRQTHFWLKHKTPLQFYRAGSWDLCSSFEIDHRF
jgi:hypothetical protein